MSEIKINRSYRKTREMTGPQKLKHNITGVHCISIRVLLYLYTSQVGYSFNKVMSVSPPHKSTQLCHILIFLSSFLFLSQDEKGGYEKWRVENSWGDDRGNKGSKHSDTLYLLSVLAVRVF